MQLRIVRVPEVIEGIEPPRHHKSRLQGLVIVAQQVTDTHCEVRAASIAMAFIMRNLPEYADWWDGRSDQTIRLPAECVSAVV